MKFRLVMIILLIGILLPGTSALPLQGTLYIASYPVGATILINGTDSGVTDTYVHNVSAGAQNLTLTKAGYEPYTIVVNVPRGEVKVLAPVTLTKCDGPVPPAGTGTLYVVSHPAGAAILINDTDYGVTGTFVHNAPSGLQNLTLTKAGYEPYTIVVNVPRGEVKVLAPVTLTRHGGPAPPAGAGTLYVASYPAGATILINGTDYGVTDTFVHNVSAGAQNLTLTKAGYTSYTTIINIPAGDTKILAPIILVKGPDVMNGSIQAAVDTATPGDTLYLAKKVYRENVVINKSLTLIGGGPGITIIDGDTDQDGESNGRVFYIGPGTEVTLVGLTVENGTAPEDGGGGILNRGTLTVKNCDIHQNSGGNKRGGGICNLADSASAKPNLTVVDCTIHQNAAVGGGGIFNWAVNGVASVKLESVNIFENGVLDTGGGIMNYGDNGTAIISIADSHVLHNTAQGGHGGGIWNNAQNDGAVASIEILSSTIGNNSAHDGGGIWNVASFGKVAITIRKSEICGNSAGAMGGPGGGIDTRSEQASGSANMDLYECRIYNNSAPGGGGILNEAMNGKSAVNLWNCEVYRNTAGSGGGILNVAYSDESNATVNGHGCSIHHNGGSNGGGVNNRAVKGVACVNLWISDISDNTADYGGGMYQESVADGSARTTLSHCSFISNTATKDGGGIWNSGLLQLKNCAILSNSANVGSGHGGGIFYTEGHLPVLTGINQIELNIPDNLFSSP